MVGVDPGGIIRADIQSAEVSLGNFLESVNLITDHGEGIGRFRPDNVLQLALAELNGRAAADVIVQIYLILCGHGAGGGHQGHDAHDPDHQGSADGHNKGQG